ncbi:cell division protein ZapA [Geomonas sp. RF6]|uniref:cell division protein ZapA n=1 Tax=Geomonas sp. RF6 TaxID=2897342 RepID=UPI001E38BA00|nr:cell division protein ZapA [Geomonas sp. RF6]UFS68764.1 cell division protein ZapA [Geomonas sp. RF6]
MTSLTTHNIKILGRELQVKSTAAAQHVAEVEALVNAKLAEAEKAVPSGDTQLVVILAMMNIAEAYLAVRKEHEAGQKALEQRVSHLMTLLDSQAG